MSYRKVKKYFQNIKLYGIIGAAVIMAMSVTACSTVKNSGTEISAAQTSAGLADEATVNGIYSPMRQKQTKQRQMIQKQMKQKQMKQKQMKQKQMSQKQMRLKMLQVVCIYPEISSL